LNLFFFFPQFVGAFGTVTPAISCGGSLCYEYLSAKLTMFWNLDSRFHRVSDGADCSCMVQHGAEFRYFKFVMLLGNKFVA